jgi:hypothetical protein
MHKAVRCDYYSDIHRRKKHKRQNIHDTQFFKVELNEKLENKDMKGALHI